METDEKTASGAMTVTKLIIEQQQEKKILMILIHLSKYYKRDKKIAKSL